MQPAQRERAELVGSTAARKAHRVEEDTQCTESEELDRRLVGALQVDRTEVC